MYMQTGKQIKQRKLTLQVFSCEISANKFWVRTKTFLTRTKVPRMARKGGLLRMLK